MTLSRPTLSALDRRIAADFDAHMKGADSRLRRSFLSVLARSNAGAFDGVYALLGWLARQLMPDTAEKEFLERHSTTWGVPRKAAGRAAGTIEIGGIVGAIVPIGAELVRVDGARFVTTERVVLAATTGSVSVEAMDAGVAGVTAEDVELTFAATPSGINAIAIAGAGLSGGADEETDAALLARLLTRIRTPPNGGAAADWETWALQLPGVTRAWAFPNWTGPGTVGVTFVLDGREDILPLEADLEAMTDHIDLLRPVTATPVIFAATPFMVNPLITVTPDTADVRAAIVAELSDLFQREAEPGGSMYVSRMREAISLAVGEFDHVLRSPAANPVAPAGYIPMLGTVTFG
ncbi:MAG: baseplate J/gp47 family protein [Sphingomonadales bacterium]|nr:MAG: baseplate J/gp47 family protein [Sphingomonadales bacterium]